MTHFANCHEAFHKLNNHTKTVQVNKQKNRKPNIIKGKRFLSIVSPGIERITPLFFQKLFQIFNLFLLSLHQPLIQLNDFIYRIKCGLHIYGIES
jgi:hypothetical protein